MNIYLASALFIIFGILTAYVWLPCLRNEVWEQGTCSGRVARRNSYSGVVQFTVSGEWYDFDVAYWPCFISNTHTSLSNGK